MRDHMSSNLAKHPLANYLVGTVGLAMLRTWWVDETIGEELNKELHQVLENRTSQLIAGGIEEGGPKAAYAVWAATYDAENVVNPLLTLEGRVLDHLFDFPHQGKALDAACGTGRHDARLVDWGYEVVGVDGSPEMLAQARAKDARVRYVEGDLRSLPLEDDSFDLVLSTLALTHIPELRLAIQEMGRVLRPGGRVVIVDVHPIQVMFGSHVAVTNSSGMQVVARNFVHNISAYFDAFSSAGMRVEVFQEPLYDRSTVDSFVPASWVPAANRAAYVGTPALACWRAIKQMEDHE